MGQERGGAASEMGSTGFVVVWCLAGIAPLQGACWVYVRNPGRCPGLRDCRPFGALEREVIVAVVVVRGREKPEGRSPSATKKAVRLKPGLLTLGIEVSRCG